MDACSITDKRSLIVATRMRFSPESQQTRETATDKIIERQLFILDQEIGGTAQEIGSKKIFVC